MTTKAKIVLGIFGALAAGLAIGVLMAPEKGVDTRMKIKRKAGGWIDSMGNIFTKKHGSPVSSVEDGKRRKTAYQGEAL